MGHLSKPVERAARRSAGATGDHVCDRRGGNRRRLTFGSAKAIRHLWSGQSPFFVKKLEDRYSFKQAKAKALLAEAGLKDGFEMTQLLLNNSEYRQIAKSLQAMLGEAEFG